MVNKEIHLANLLLLRTHIQEMAVMIIVGQKNKMRTKPLMPSHLLTHE